MGRFIVRGLDRDEYEGLKRAKDNGEGDMIITVQNLGSRPETVTETLDGPVLDEAIVSPVAVELTLKFEVGLLRISGEISYRAKGECFRCLEPVEVQVDSSFETQIDLVAGRLCAVDLELDEDESEGTFHRLDNGDLDLRGEIESRILQSLPPRFLCRENCSGISYKKSGEDVQEEKKTTPFADLSILLDEKNRN